MASKKQRQTADGRLVVATNRRARREYEVIDTVEAGLVLKGSEVKSLRAGHVQIAEAYARVVNGEMWLIGCHISPYSHASHEVPAPVRDRKLLLHRAEIMRLGARVDQDRLTLIPLSIYFREGRAKVELALARGRKLYDKRQAIAKRTADREAQRAMANKGRGW